MAGKKGRKTIKGTDKPATVYEKSVKQAVLDSKTFFRSLGDLGKSRIIFEKTCGYGELIADCLIFTENRGIIGVEIKTAHDTLKRLSKQLDSYVRVCNYVYVFCHDSHLEAVEALIKRKGLVNTVGIISYIEFKDDVIGGVVKEAQPNSRYELTYALEMLWKKQIERVIHMFTDKQEQLAINTYGGIAPVQDRRNLSGGMRMVGQRTSKKNLIRVYVDLLGEVNGTKILCQQFQTVQPYPDRVLKLYKFKED